MHTLDVSFAAPASLQQLDDCSAQSSANTHPLTTELEQHTRYFKCPLTLHEDGEQNLPELKLTEVLI